MNNYRLFRPLAYDILMLRMNFEFDVNFFFFLFCEIVKTVINSTNRIYIKFSVTLTLNSIRNGKFYKIVNTFDSIKRKRDRIKIMTVYFVSTTRWINRWPKFNKH